MEGFTHTKQLLNLLCIAYNVTVRGPGSKSLADLNHLGIRLSVALYMSLMVLGQFKH